MTQQDTIPSQRKAVLAIGIILVVVAVLLLGGFGVWLANKGKVFSSGSSADAILFIDIPGRIAIDGILQIEGPAPVPVSVGDHTLTAFDVAAQEPIEVSVQQGDFVYVANPAVRRGYRTNESRGFVRVSAFPPDTTVEIPDCTPLDAPRPVTCKGKHVVTADLSPGTYTINYSNPNLGEYQESFTIAADTVARREYSFITTVTQWDEWRRQHGDVIEKRYSRYSRRSGADDALLLPFEVTGVLLGDLLD